ncbi:MAG: thiamine-phosphate kinase [Endomicrobium sp.]|jgi:thiamine-monophosphate kinase|nr:thiamine-phosphate kinase [Endomicrobium sp.]
MKTQTISYIGEFGLINLIKKTFSNITKDKNIIVDIGDDCFCFKAGKDYIHITKDMLVEEGHFKTSWTSPYELGKKAIEVNISDLAAMGNVIPKYIFIGLGTPANTSEDFVRNLLKGIQQACNKYNIALSGGDTVKADKIIISVTAIGISKNKPLTRTGSQIGDLIGVTNSFGDSGAGVYLLNKYGTKHKYTKHERALIKAQNSPSAMLNEACKVSKYLTSLIDASDGLFVSLNLLIQGFSKGANINIEQIPVSKNLKAVFNNDKQILNFALFGAEDYQLVFTVPKLKAKIVKKLVPSITYIGKITTGTKVKYFYNGKEQKVKYCGFKHF